MGIKDRRLREQQQLRRNILDAVRELAIHDGWQAVTVRKIADKIEYSAPTIYEYFASKEAIIDELRKEGFRWLLEAIRAARDSVARPEEQIMAMAMAYWDFAWKYPEVYQAMHGLDGVPCDPKLTSPEANEVFFLSCDVLRAFARECGTDIPDVEEAIDIIRAMLHGLIGLVTADRVIQDKTRNVNLIRRAITDLLKVWGRK